MRKRPYIAFIWDPGARTVGEYIFHGRSRRQVERDVREWCKRTDWGATIVAIERAVVPGVTRVTARGLLGRRHQREQLVGHEHIASPALVQPLDREEDELRTHVG